MNAFTSKVVTLARVAAAAWPPILAVAVVCVSAVAVLLHPAGGIPAAAVDRMFDDIRLGDLAAVERALDAGMPVEVTQDAGDLTPLMAAARHGRREIVELLLRRGAGLNASSRAYGTPLANAASMGHADLVGLLLAHGADPDVPDVLGFRPIMTAALSGDDPACIDLLIRAGADVNATCHVGHNALAVAVANDHHRVARRLAGASRAPDRTNTDAPPSIVIPMERQRLRDLGVASRNYSEIPRRRASSG